MFKMVYGNHGPPNYLLLPQNGKTQLRSTLFNEFSNITIALAIAMLHHPSM